MRIHTPLEEKLYTWAKAFVPQNIEDIIFADQNGIEPNNDFIVLEVVSVTSDMPAELRYKSIDLSDQIEENAIYRGVVNLRMRVITKENTLETAEEIKTRIWMTKSLETLEAVNLGINSIGESSNMSFLENERSRYRADIPILLHYTATYQDIIQTIGKVTVKGYNSVDGTQIVDTTIEEPGYAP